MERVLIALVLLTFLMVELPGCGDGAGNPAISVEPNVFEGDFTISSHADIDSLTKMGDGANKITGNLSIRETPLTGLSGLEGLESIGKNLFIRDNPALTSLEGFPGLTNIGGWLTISGNPMLASIEGLGSLTAIGENLFIGAN